MGRETANSGPTRRRWFRFSLRTFLIGVTLLSVVLGFYISRVQNEGRAAQAISDASGEIVYDWQIRPPGSDPNVQPTPPGPQWLRKYLGPHWFDRIVEVRLNGYLNNPAKHRFTKLGPHLAKLQKLRSLQLCVEELSDDDYRVLGQLSQLEELSLRQKSKIEPDQATALAHAPRLRELYLSYANITPDALRELAALPNLEILQITCDSYDRKTGADLKEYQLLDNATEALAKFSNLRTLMVFHTQITDKGMANLCLLDGLETLVVSSPNITSASFDDVVKLKHLKHLGTWAWKINDADFAKLSQLPNLRSLGLVTWLTDKSVVELVKLDQIERLTLEGDKITDASLRHLAELRKLVWLDMSSTSVAKYGQPAKELQQALPKCHINLPRTKEEEAAHRAFLNWQWGGASSASNN